MSSAGINPLGDDDNYSEYSTGRDNNEHAVPANAVEIPEDGSVGFSWRKLWAFSGPSLLVSLAYLDPGNIESDLQAGVAGEYSLLWVLFWATAAGYLLQTLASRLGVTTGIHLAEECRKQYSWPIRYTLWINMELAIIGSDIQEVIGSALAIRILSNGAIPLWAGALITGADTFTFLFLERYGLRKLEYLFAVLISVMVGTFGYIYSHSDPDQAAVVKGIAVPSLEHDTSVQAVALMGAVIMPHNLFLHSALVLSRKIDIKNPVKVKEANLYNGIELSIALLVSFIINLFVVAVFAAGDPDDDITLSSAGDYLRDTYGKAVLYIWAVGLLAAGQASTMTGCYAGQFVMQGFLRLNLPPWKRVLLTRTVAMVPTVLVAVFTDENLNGFDQWINVLQSLQLPFALFPLLHFTSSPGIMGRFVNPRWMNILSWLVALLIVAVNIYLIFDTFKTSLPHTVAVFLPLGAAMLAYFIFSLYLAVGPFLRFGTMNHIYGPLASKGLVGANLRSRLNQLNFQDLEGEANTDGFADDFAPLLQFDHEYEDEDNGL
eukprot:m.238075 g.238075  ORF g.238075 m.238075 type:complete len:546 (-) comp17423_c0_seq5:3929-5566(-)